ncbi:hypothetical protein [Rhodocaloribacter sp.]
MTDRRSPFAPARRRPSLSGVVFLLAALLGSFFGCAEQPLFSPLNPSGEASASARSAIPSTGLIPLIDMADTTYFGFTGGLYPGGSNTMPDPHLEAGLAHMAEIRPLDPAGNPDALNGKYVLLSIGMSQAAESFCEREVLTDICTDWSFMEKAATDPDVNHSTLAIINGADGGGHTRAWDQVTDPEYDEIRDEHLAPLGLTEAQVQIVWLKTNNNNGSNHPSLPDPEADVYQFIKNMGDILRTLKIRYPNLKMAFLSSRSYGGYASLTANSPEPYAYENGFGIKWTIEAQINQMATGEIDPQTGNLDYDTVAPWIGWGPYWWADGVTPRSDGLSWPRDYYDEGGGHLARKGEDQEAGLLMDFFSTSPLTMPWFLDGGPEVAVTLAPRTEPVEIPPGGGDFEFRITVENLGAAALDVQYWTMMTRPDGSLKYGIDAVDVTLAPGESMLNAHTQTLPGTADAGDYVYYAYAGTFPDVILAADSLTFVKLE